MRRGAFWEKVCSAPLPELADVGQKGGGALRSRMVGGKRGGRWVGAMGRREGGGEGKSACNTLSSI